ncbi:hypothetical protein J3459_007617 [Metarhizium acridum]|nr:hypothetical protein J3459_007617 [Metarhizium acridum]
MGLARGPDARFLESMPFAKSITRKGGRWIMSMPQLTFGQHGLWALGNLPTCIPSNLHVQAIIGNCWRTTTATTRQSAATRGAKPPDKVTESLLRLPLPSIQTSSVWWYGSGHLERRPFWRHHNFLSSPRDTRKRFERSVFVRAGEGKQKKKFWPSGS